MDLSLAPRSAARRPAPSVQGRAVTVLGLGTHGGGAAAARWLAEQGAKVTISDLADKEQLAAAVASLADVPIGRWSLGGHRWDDFANAELVVVNPAVPPDSPWLKRLAATGTTQLTSEIELFLERCPGTVVGVTGTVGKSTTASLIAAALQAAGRRTWLGGNIGRSLLADLPAMTSSDVIVLELSSFQLHHLSETARWPELAVVTNFSPNHLAWHGGLAGYATAKQRLVAESLAVAIDPADPSLAAWLPCTATQIPVGSAPAVVARQTWGQPLFGPHQQRNAALAAATAAALGADQAAIDAGFASFAGLPHRFQRVATLAGRQLVNDSKATTPEAVAAALEACTAPVWLLAGGQHKGGDWRRVAQLAAHRARGVALYGQDAAQLSECFLAAGVHAPQLANLEDAANWCWQRALPGDIVLLSPGCASFDQFRDFHHRGETFCNWVASLAAVEAVRRHSVTG